jgi:hypothetical protein
MPTPARRRLDKTERTRLTVVFHPTVEQCALALSLNDDFNPRPERPFAIGDALKMIREVLLVDSHAVVGDPHAVIAIETGTMPDPYRPPVSQAMEPFANDFTKRRRRYRQALQILIAWGPQFTDRP